jgi:hypothetical protein
MGLGSLDLIPSYFQVLKRKGQVPFKNNNVLKNMSVRGQKKLY